MKKVFIHTSGFLLALAITFVPAYLVLAVETPTGNINNPPNGSINNPVNGSTQRVNTKIENPFKGGNSITELFLAILNGIVLPIGGILAIFAFIYAGFKYVMAQGNESAIQEANRTLWGVAVGTVILLGSVAIAKAIEATINQLK